MHVDSSLQITTSIVETTSDFFALQDEWEALSSKSRSRSIFLTFEWLSTWLSTFHELGHLCVVVAKHENDVVGIAPLMVEHRNGFRRLGSIGVSTLDYEDFLVSDELPYVQVFDSLLSAVFEYSGWDYLQINRLREDSSTLECFYDLPRRSRVKVQIQPSEVSPYVDTQNEWAPYWDSLSSRFRKDSDRMERNLERDFGQVEFREVSSDSEIDQVLEFFFSMHRSRRLFLSGDEGIFGDEHMRDFYSNLAHNMFHKGWLRMPIASVAGAPAAVHLDFMYAGSYSHAMPVFDDAYSKYGIARLLNLNMMRDAFTSCVTSVDFLRGDEPYKFDFNPAIMKLYSVALYRPTARGSTARLWHGQLRPSLRQSKKLKTIRNTVKRLKAAVSG